MCGIVAYVDRNKLDPSYKIDFIEKACNCMAVRGPDAQKIWQDENVTLGHRRLAILDIDPRSNQPFLSMCNRYAIVFNGEIYNFKELRLECESVGDIFYTDSDTEVLLSLYSRYGESMLSRLRGMFAFFIWDKISQEGFAARDPYGIKPLYYSQTTNGFILASQVKAILATNEVSYDKNLAAQAGFLLTGSVPEPETWYKDIYPVLPGYCMRIKNGKITSNQAWHDIRDNWQVEETKEYNNKQIELKFHKAIRESVSAHMVSDVPVGIFLSGGIDSGSLAGLMKECGAQSIKGITIAFGEFLEGVEDETPDAIKIAKYYGIEHHIRYVTREEFEQDFPEIIRSMDQPSIDGVNTWYASKAASELGLKVVISGIGGDEILQGYPSFNQIPKIVKIWKVLSKLPGMMKFSKYAAKIWAKYSSNERWLYAPVWALELETTWLLRRGLFAPSELPHVLGKDLSNRALREFKPIIWAKGLLTPCPKNPKVALSQIESLGYLRNQLLRDVDWASMHHGIEVRTRLVDSFLLKQISPFLNSFENFPNKSLLSTCPALPLPKEITSKKKTGFGIPIGEWLKQLKIIDGDDSNKEWAKLIMTLTK